MNYLPRHLEKSLARACHSFPVLLLTGPRQVGKTTLLQHLAERERRYITLDDLNLRAQAREDPALFMRQFPPPILIDEIQYAPELLPYIKIQVDQARENNLYWLTGSQQFLLMQNVTESLAGRVALVNLLGLSWRERQRLASPEDIFLPPEKLPPGEVLSVSPSELFHTIWEGGFPALVSGQSSEWELFYSSYLQTYIQRDVRDLRQIGSLEQFTRFVRACAARTAQVLNLSDLANDVSISVKTAKSWLSILEAGFQVFLLRPYFSNRLKRLIKSPKLYFLDTGLCASLTGWDSPDTLMKGAMAGQMFETFVLGEFLKRSWNLLKQPAIYYYRDRQKNEIDFILEANQELFPVEVKLGATLRKDWFGPFKCLKGHARGAVICQIDQPMLIDEQNLALPWSAL